MASLERVRKTPEAYRTKNPGLGSKKRNSSKMYFSIYVDEIQVEELRALALKQQISMSEQIRRFIDWGLEEFTDELR